MNGLLNNTHPLWVAVASALFYQPRRPGLLVGGSAVALVGVGLVFLPDLAFGAAAGAAVACFPRFSVEGWRGLAELGVTHALLVPTMIETLLQEGALEIGALRLLQYGAAPIHPDTLSFLAAAAGFTEVRVELKSPVEPAARLQPVPPEGLPARAAEALNENVARLNDLLYAPQEYVMLARR